MESPSPVPIRVPMPLSIFLNFSKIAFKYSGLIPHPLSVMETTTLLTFFSSKHLTRILPLMGVNFKALPIRLSRISLIRSPSAERFGSFGEGENSRSIFFFCAKGASFKIDFLMIRVRSKSVNWYSIALTSILE